MIIIYDFDGTLTPSPIPQYPILKHCGYNAEKMLERIKDEIENNNNFYEAYYKCFMNILIENDITLSKNNIIFGAQNTIFNNGVIDYFTKFQSSQTGIKHYIVTSGLKDYVDGTAISKFVDGVFGVTFTEQNGIFQDIDILLSDKKKIDAIQQIQKKNNNTNKIVYFGDGLTDNFAFNYVHNIGGNNVFIASNEYSKTNYEKLNEDGIINEYFDADFRENSQISNYIKSLIPKNSINKSNNNYKLEI